MNKPKCPKCNEEATLILNEDNFNVMFNMIDNLHLRFIKMERKIREMEKQWNKKKKKN